MSVRARGCVCVCLCVFVCVCESLYSPVQNPLVESTSYQHLLIIPEKNHVKQATGDPQALRSPKPEKKFTFSPKPRGFLDASMSLNLSG